MNSLFCITKDMEVPINVMFKLFDSYVLSILNYDCEVWGFIAATNIERIHRKFCKRLLNVKLSTNSMSLYAELGRLSLYIGRYLRNVKYFLKLHQKKQGNCILTTVINMQRLEIETQNNTVNWSFKVRKILNQTGFTDVRLFPESVIIESFIPLLKTRLIDQYVSEWRVNVDSSTSLLFYKELKPVFERSVYLDVIDNKNIETLLLKYVYRHIIC